MCESLTHLTLSFTSGIKKCSSFLLTTVEQQLSNTVCLICFIMSQGVRLWVEEEFVTERWRGGTSL